MHLETPTVSEVNYLVRANMNYIKISIICTQYFTRIFNFIMFMLVSFHTKPNTAGLYDHVRIDNNTALPRLHEQ